MRKIQDKWFIILVLAAAAIILFEPQLETFSSFLDVLSGSSTAYAVTALFLLAGLGFATVWGFSGTVVRINENGSRTLRARTTDPDKRNLVYVVIVGAIACGMIIPLLELHNIITQGPTETTTFTQILSTLFSSSSSPGTVETSSGVTSGGNQSLTTTSSTTSNSSVSAGSSATSDDAYSIVTAAIKSGATIVHLAAGNYTVSQSIRLTSIQGLEIYGDGQGATVLTLASGVNGPVLALSNCDDFKIHDFTIDGNTAGNQSGTDGNGINHFQCTGGLIQNMTIQNCRNFGIEQAQPTNCTVDHCVVLNSGSNGINTNTVNAGDNNTVQYCTVDGASDVGITNLAGGNYLCQFNTVRNITLMLSAYDLNTHLGIDAQEGPPVQSFAPGAVTKVYQNLVENCFVAGATYEGEGIGASPDSNSSGASMIIMDNTIINCERGLSLGSGASGQSLSMTGNTIQGGGDLVGKPILVSGSWSSVDIEDNTVKGLPAKMKSPLISLQSPTGAFINNTIYTNGAKTVFDISTPSGWTNTPNTIITTS